MEAKVFDINGSETSDKLALNKDIFGLEPNEHAMYLDVKLILANKRQGTHKAKERAEVTGSTKKIKRQKGTGTARAGSIKSPLFKGGGRAFGPRVRDYDFKVNKKVRRLARKSALSSKYNDNAITFLTDFSFDAPKTKNYVQLLSSFKIENERTLIVTGEKDRNIELSVRNVERAQYLSLNELNTYDILKAKKLFMTKAAVADLEKFLN